jgi:lysyl-tRNA synthetase class 2
VARIDDLAEQRRQKLRRIRASGTDPYPSRYSRSHTTKEAVKLFKRGEDTSISLAGRIVARRDMGKVAFVDLHDSSGKIQAYFSRKHLGDAYDFLDNCDIGDIVGVKGRVFKTRTGEITVEVSDFTILSKSLLPLPEKWHGLTDVEKRYRQRYLDLIAGEDIVGIFMMRSRVISAIRRFMEERGFVEVETPVLHPVAGGALANPFITHHHALDQELYLRIATELYLKRLIVGGFEKVYEIGRIFRNEGISTKHNPEFTMMESYEAYADYNDVMQMLEEMVAVAAKKVLRKTRVRYGEETLEFEPPWKRISLRDAVKAGCGIDFLERDDGESLRKEIREQGLQIDEGLSWGQLLDKLISHYVEPKLIQPTILFDYPVAMSPLAKRKPDDNRLVERFEAFAGGIEIANAFTELNDPVEQRERFEEQERIRKQLGDAEAERVDEDFLVAIEHGMPPTGGLGVGIDRLVMLLTNQQSIREVILFPQMRTK